MDQHVKLAIVAGTELRTQGWVIRRLITIFAKCAKRPHEPRDAGVRDLFRQSNIPIPSSV